MVLYVHFPVALRVRYVECPTLRVDRQIIAVRHRCGIQVQHGAHPPVRTQPPHQVEIADVERAVRCRGDLHGGEKALAGRVAGALVPVALVAAAVAIAECGEDEGGGLLQVDVGAVPSVQNALLKRYNLCKNPIQ